MTVGLKASISDLLLDALLNSVAYDGPSNLWIKLHTGDPGAAGTANAASNTTRKEVTFSASSGGAITNDNAPQWDAVPTAEDYSHISVWDASTAGNFLFSAVMTANAVGVGDTFIIALGDLDITLGAVAA